MAKTRNCKVCGTSYEYCGHCPGKNKPEPWRTLYCSEKCRDAFKLMGDYVSNKVSAEEAKNKLVEYGLNVGKVREIHKPVVADIFRAAMPKQQPISTTVPIENEKSLEITVEDKTPEKVIVNNNSKPYQKDWKKKNIVKKD